MVLEGRTAATHGFKAVSKPVPLLLGCTAHLVCMAAVEREDIISPLLADIKKDIRSEQLGTLNTFEPMDSLCNWFGQSPVR